ncbi:MAG: branched-chain amino acid ABC transporter permease [Thermoleophilia bacterium]|nr:branched-chain amino acid ABC transporter permease [Thermoleophilia bacterium]
MRRYVFAVAWRVAALAALAIAILVLPRYVGVFRANQFALVGIFFIALLGLNIVTGHAGQISLAHGAFMAIGGYTTAILVSGGPTLGEPLNLWPNALEGGVRDLWTIPLAGLAAALAGFLFALPALRLTGLYLALATFAIAVATPAVLAKPAEITGGSRGIQLFGLPELSGKGFEQVGFLGHDVPFEDFVYYVTWLIAAALFAAAWLMLNGRIGRAFRAVRDSEVAAAASGVNPAAYKTLAFAVSAFYAGVAGSLYVILNWGAAPRSFPVLLSIQLLIGLVVAGLGSLGTLVLGALFIQFLPEAIRRSGDLGLLPDALQRWGDEPGAPNVVFGAVLVTLVLLLPTGAAGLPRRAAAALTSRRYSQS